MNRFRSILFAIVAVVGVTAVGASAQNFAPSSRAPKTIEQQVQKKLRMLPRYDVFDNITATVSGSTVTLNGKVRSLGTRRDAADEIKRIPGVTQVINNIENLSPSSFDDQIRRQAYMRFIQHGPAQYFDELNPDVRIIVDGGHITLEGYVYRKSDADVLTILAKGLPNVFSVTSNLIVGHRAS